MDFIFVAIGVSVHAIFLYKRALLFQRKSFWILFVVSFGFFVLSYVLLQMNFGNPKMVVMLRIPALAMVIFFIMKSIFFRIYNKNPEDSFWSMDIRLMKDGIFNFLFWVIGLLLPIFLSLKAL